MDIYLHKLDWRKSVIKEEWNGMKNEMEWNEE
jgi:hypothetical protein